MDRRSIDDGYDGEYSGVGFVAITQVFVMQDAIIFGIISFGRVAHLYRVSESIPFTRVS